METKRNVDRWVSALRSGNFAQTTGQLADTDGEEMSFCCLGLGCKVLGVERTEADGIIYFDEQDSLPPISFHEKVGSVGADGDEVNLDALDVLITNTDGVTENLGVVGLATMNDDWNLTFAQIGDLIDYFGIR